MRSQGISFTALAIILTSLALAACSDALPPATTQPSATPVAASPSPTAVVEQAASACVTDSLTPSQAEGPYYKAGSPERVSLLEEGMGGTRIVIEGRVFSRGCVPIAGAQLDFWQADDAGEYDNSGYTLRGHQSTDGEGHYRVETVVPGLYPGRTRHIHLKVSLPGRQVLTTQLYFPGEGSNTTDGIFDGRLVLPVQDAADGKHAVFDFVVDVE